MTVLAAEPTAVQLFATWWPWCQAVALVAVFAAMYLVGVKS